jgi:hypothetical protein
MKHLFLLAALLLSACSTKPFVLRMEGTPATETKPAKRPVMVASLGWSIGTKSKEESGSLELPDGTKMSYSVSGKNEVAIPNAYIAGQTAEALGAIAAGVTNAQTAAGVTNAQTAADQAVKIQQSKDAVEIAKIPVEAAP